MTLRKTWLNPLPNTITLEMSGPKGRLRQLEEHVLTLPIDLRNANIGTISLTLDESMVQGLPDSIEVERFTPPILEIEFATPVIREIPLKLNFIGSLDDDLSISKVELNPSSMTLKGAESTLNQISEILTKPINQNEITQSTTFTTQAIKPKNTLEFVENTDINVQIEVIERNLETIYSDIKLTWNNLTWTTDQNEVNVLVKAPIDLEINPEKIQVQVNINSYLKQLPETDTQPPQSISFIEHPELFSIQGVSKNDVVLMNIEPNTLVFTPKQ